MKRIDAYQAARDEVAIVYCGGSHRVSTWCSLRDAWLQSGAMSWATACDVAKSSRIERAVAKRMDASFREIDEAFHRIGDCRGRWEAIADAVCRSVRASRKGGAR